MTLYMILLRLVNVYSLISLFIRANDGHESFHCLGLFTPQRNKLGVFIKGVFIERRHIKLEIRLFVFVLASPFFVISIYKRTLRLF